MRTSEQNKEYMKVYYQENKEKWDESRKARRDKINARKREQYRTDLATQAYYKNQAKEYRKKNPERRRQHEVLKRYGLTTHAYDRIYESQNGNCAICNEPFAKTPHVDHCHETNKARGLLCDNCNHGLGKFHDSIETLYSAIRYLRRHKEADCVAI